MIEHFLKFVHAVVGLLSYPKCELNNENWIEKTKTIQQHEKKSLSNRWPSVFTGTLLGGLGLLHNMFYQGKTNINKAKNIYEKIL